MNKKELEKVGKQWVEEEIITEEQLRQILNREQTTNVNSIIILFAALLTVLGFILFMMSDWAQQQGLSRVFLFTLVTLAFYLVGAIWYRKRQDIFGISFIAIGYVLFGIGLIQLLFIYDVIIYTPWPIMVWGVIGLGLIYLFDHPLLYGVVTGVFVFGHIYYASSLAYFSWGLFLIFLLGLGLYTVRKSNKLYNYLFSIAYMVNMIILITSIENSYYWFILMILPFYIVSDFVKKESLRLPMRYISIVTMFLFMIIQSFMLDSDWYMQELELQWSFVYIWFVLILVSVGLKKVKNRLHELIDCLLFLPIVFIPGSYLLSFIILFTFSLLWIFLGFRRNNQRDITIGTTTFLVTTFITYIQFAWNTMNRSLFFFIGALLLFAIGFIMDKQMKQLRMKKQEEEE